MSPQRHITQIPFSTQDVIAEEPKHEYCKKYSSNLHKFAGVSQCSCSKKISILL